MLLDERPLASGVEPAMWDTPNGGRPERYGRTFGYAHSQLQRTNIRRSVARQPPTCQDKSRQAATRVGR
jgi:hypothetical protein